MEDKELKFDSVCVHMSIPPDNKQACLTPIYASSTYFFKSSEDALNIMKSRNSGYLYSRYGNPNHDEVEKKIALLEGYKIENLKLGALLFASGQAAHSTLFQSNLKSGDKILVSPQLYGGTYDLVYKILDQVGIQGVQGKYEDLAQVEEQIVNDPAIKWMHIESPSNPLTICFDIEKLTEIAHKHNIKVSVDNTFATPYLQQPFKFGVDYVVHSTTKFLNGHGTAVGGVIVTRHIEFLEEKILKWQRIMGGNSNPFDAFLLNQGLKTLSLRMEKHCSNAQKVAEFLEGHKNVSKVYYLGLKSHPSHELAKKQMRGFGGMVSLEIAGGYEPACKFQNALKFCTRAVSLGNVDTLVCHPASTSHYAVEKAQRLKVGITDGLVRMSIGIEDPEDIISDLKQALDSLSE